MRGRAALASALPQDSMSAGTARDSAQIIGPSISCAIFRTASKSSGDDAGKPASIISTFSRASWRASVILSRLPRRVPAACSPSLRVVSNTAIFDVAFIAASSMILNWLSGAEQPNYSSIPQEGFRKCGDSAGDSAYSPMRLESSFPNSSSNAVTCTWDALP